jgi:hypothetical protein
VKLALRRASRAACLVPLLLIAASCATETITRPVRSLEQSGRVAFVCLAAPGTLPGPGLPITSCGRGTTTTPYEFGVDKAGNTTVPHTYALITQTTRGEVAIVDMTANEDWVIDQDPNVPGANFLPVGAQPTDVVATAGGTAAFVSVAEVGREGIFALPSTKMRNALISPTDPACKDEENDKDCAPPTLSSFPACSLPSAPGLMLLVSDPEVDGAVRPSCDGAYGELDDAEALKNGDLSLEKGGRQKLVVAMPDLGGFAVIDAQSLLGRAAGSFEECDIERWVPLKTDVPAPPQQGSPPPEMGCVNPEPPLPAAQTGAASRPAGLAFADEHLYVADLGVPIVHVVEMPTPCEPIERPPLVTGSIEDPARVVTTSRVAVSPRLTADLRRYLYAVDNAEGSVMVFDVSDDAEPRYPLSRPHPEWNPFQPSDRIRFGAPVRDLLIIDRDSPQASPVTGAAPEGTRCDPNPELEVCTSESLTCDPATLYRTAADYSTGAGPFRLRGSFAFLMLTTGRIVVADVDDLDASCRAPGSFSEIYGCPPSDPAIAWATSKESSCNVVQQHTPRSARFIVSNELGGHTEPALQSYPLLHDKTGTLVPPTDTTVPRMRATLPVDGASVLITVGGAIDTIDSDTGLVTKDDGLKHTLVMNLEDPRAHVNDQPWIVTYEGALPGFEGRAAELALLDAGADPTAHVYELRDADSQFCGRGTVSTQNAYEALTLAGTPGTPEELQREAARRADFAQILNDLAPEDDVYWESATCSYLACKGLFGTAATPRPEREFTIREAYQDRIQIESVAELLREQQTAEKAMDSSVVITADDVRSKVKCCFPTLVGFNIRASDQWVVIGGVNGFSHHVIADPETGVCRSSCDPTAARLNGRVRSAPNNVEKILDGSEFAFQNPQLRFGITQGPNEPQRDMQFRFVTQGSFAPMFMDLTLFAETADLQPNSITYLPATGDLVVSDGLLEGLFLINPGSVDITRQFF